MKKIVTIPPGRQEVSVVLKRFYKENRQGDLCAASARLTGFLVQMERRKKVVMRQLQGKLGTADSVADYVAWRQIVNGRGVVLEIDISRMTAGTTCEFEVLVNAVG